LPSLPGSSPTSPSNLDHPKALEDIPAGLTLWRQSLQYSCPFTLELVKMSRASDCCGISPAEDSGERTGIVPLDRLGYLDFLLLNDRARMVLTDSDGVLAEATVLGVPCLTQRETTERPATVDQGTNQVVGVDPDRILLAAQLILHSGIHRSRTSRPPSPWIRKKPDLDLRHTFPLH
jgi:UDP-N-acetylglucosamine 2-epimerase (non-hydrolysing)